MKKMVIVVIFMTISLLLTHSAESDLIINDLKPQTISFGFYRLNLTDSAGNKDYGFYEVEQPIFSRDVIVRDKTKRALPVSRRSRSAAAVRS